MKCPYCSHADSKVIDKRETGSDQEITRRRRECLGCNKRFTTYETVEHVEITVIKKDESREIFDRNKILSGILRACEKRPVSRDQIESTVNEIKADLVSKGAQEVISSDIGELIMEKLQKLDKIAYIRFASVYRQFADIQEFEKELSKLLRQKGKLE